MSPNNGISVYTRMYMYSHAVYECTIYTCTCRAYGGERNKVTALSFLVHGDMRGAV